MIHARLLELRPGPLVELLGSLMATIVLPYRGSAAAARELDASGPADAGPGARGGDGSFLRPLGDASPVDYRLTVRAQMALDAVAGRPGLNNREVSEIIGLADQSQISRMMKRLAEQGLVENTQGQAKRLARAWRLTSDGEAAIDAHRGRASTKAQHTTSRGGSLVAESTRRGKSISQAGPAPSRPRDSIAFTTAAFRLTVLTHEVLAAVANLSGQGFNPSNREIAQAAGVKDEGQISKLLRRLERHRLLQNTGGHPAAGNAWQLTLRGEELLTASRPSRQGEGQ